MRQVPADLAAHLAGDITTVCQCWRVTRSDGTVLGFTEHDRDLGFGGLTYRAASGFQASDAETGAGLAAEASEVAGGFSSAAISETDLSAGRYDGARVEVFLVDWQHPERHMLLRVGEIGEVTRAGEAFRAEIRRLTHALDQVKGRIYGHRCDAMLGDARCGVDLDTGGLQAAGEIVAVLDERRLAVSGLDGFAARYFRYGVLTFESGMNAGLFADIDDHRNDGGAVELTLWLPMPLAMAAGDRFTIVAGCDKRFATCRDKFANQLNFRGFPHMPGSDFAYGYADGDTVHDGRPLYA
jgi:uncharacterized phage protein (TIGR02218 family)